METKFIQGRVVKQWPYRDHINSLLVERKDKTTFVYKFEGVKQVYAVGDEIGKSPYSLKEVHGDMTIYSMLLSGENETYAPKEGDNCVPLPILSLKWDTCVIQAGMALLSTGRKFESEGDFILESMEMAANNYQGNG